MQSKGGVIHFNHFSSIEDNQICELLSGETDYCETLKHSNGLSERFGRTFYLYIQRAFQLGCISYKPFAQWLLSHRENGWRSDEIEFIINHCELSRSELAIALNRSKSSVSKQCFELRLNNGGYFYAWNESEISYLRRNSAKLSIGQMQKALNRSSVDIRHQVLKQGWADNIKQIQFTGRPKSRLDVLSGNNSSMDRLAYS